MYHFIPRAPLAGNGDTVPDGITGNNPILSASRNVTMDAPNDIDVYQVNIDPASPFTLRVAEAVGTVAPVAIDLLDGSGAVVEAGQIDATGRFTIGFIPEEAGTYFLRVASLGDTGFNFIEYDDFISFNNENGTTLEVGEDFDDNAVVLGDPYTISVALEEGQSIVVTIDTSQVVGGAISFFADVYDPSGYLLDFTEEQTMVYTAEITATESGIHYIELFSNFLGTFSNVQVEVVQASAFEARNDDFSTTSGLVLSDTVISNDIFPGVEDVVGWELNMDAANGSVTVDANGDFTYTPDIGFDGTDTFTYDMFAEGLTRRDTGTVTVMVAKNVINGTGANDNLSGDTSNDAIFGKGGDDFLFGLAGNDCLFGQTGDDQLEGGAGDDEIVGGQGDDRMFGDDGNDEIDGGAGNDFAQGGNGDDEIDGGDGKDKLKGGNGDDEIDGAEGKDKLFGDKGNDTLFGFDGKDRLKGGKGDDRLKGEDGNDKLFGDQGKDMLLGGNDDDALFGGDDNDRLEGDDGDDFLNGEAGRDRLFGGTGNDDLYGGKGDDTLDGEDGDDLLEGGKGEDLLLGGIGDDELYGDADNDELEGNAGDDLLNGGDGDDELYGESGNDQLFGEDGFDYLEGGEGDDELDGGEGEDILVGGDGTDILSGGNGIDELFGDGGRDTLNGGGGDDSLSGGVDNDTYIFNLGTDQNDVIREADADGGDDRIQIAADVDFDDWLFSRDGNDMLISDGDGLQIRIEDFTTAPVETIEDSAGDSLDLMDIFAGL